MYFIQYTSKLFFRHIPLKFAKPKKKGGVEGEGRVGHVKHARCHA